MRPRRLHNRYIAGVTMKQCVDAGMALTLIFLLAYIWLADRRLLAGVVILLLINMILPTLFRPFAAVWFGFSGIMGAIMSRVILTFVFFTVVTPMALIRRLLGADDLSLKQWKKGSGSVFVVRNHTYTTIDMEHPF